MLWAAELCWGVQAWSEAARGRGGEGGREEGFEGMCLVLYVASPPGPSALAASRCSESWPPQSIKISSTENELDHVQLWPMLPVLGGC